MAKKYVQIPTAYLSGSGVIIGAVNVVVNSFTDIYGNTLTIADFGDTGYGTIEPDTNNEESFTFTTVTANANGTTTLGGVSSTLAKSPYTASSGLIRQHSGGTKIVVTDSSAFWATFANKSNDETITGLYTFTQNPVGLNPGAITDASATTIGITRISASPNKTLGVATITIASPAVITFNAHGLTLSDRIQFTTTGALPTGLTASTTYYVIAAGLTANTFQISTTQLGTAIITTGSQSGVQTLIKNTPVAIADTDYRILTNSFGVDSGTANAHVVTLPYTSPTVLVSGTLVSYLALNTNTLAVTVNVAGTGVKTIKKLAGATDLVAGDIVAGQIIEIEYNATSGFWQMLVPVANASITSAGLVFSDFGDGSDGAGAFDGATTVLGMVPSTNVYTMTRDIYLSSATISTGVTVITTGYRFFCSGVLTFNGTGKISYNGSSGGTGGNGGVGVAGTGGVAGTAGSAAAALAFGSVAGGVAGIIGGVGGIGRDGSGSSGAAGGSSGAAANAVNSVGSVASSASNGGAGGGGFNGVGGGSGGTGTVAGTLSNPPMMPRITNWATTLHFFNNGTIGFMNGSAQAPGGSGGGGAAGGNQGAGTAGGGGGGGGGGSGSSGGIVMVSAYSIIGGYATCIQALGGNGGIGGNGGNGSANFAGGGGGGSGGTGGTGGVVCFVYHFYTGTPISSASVAGGSGGAFGTAGTAGTSGQAGTVGSVGTTGAIGKTYIIAI